MDSAGSGGTIQALSQGGQDLALAQSAQLAPLMANTQLQSAALMPQIAQMQNAPIDILSQLGGYQQSQANPLQSSIWPLISQMLMGNQMENIASQQPGGMGYSMLTSGMGSLLGTEKGAGALIGGLGSLAGMI
jgi:hypothetical protein